MPHLRYTTYKWKTSDNRDRDQTAVTQKSEPLNTEKKRWLDEVQANLISAHNLHLEEKVFKDILSINGVSSMTFIISLLFRLH